MKSGDFIIAKIILLLILNNIILANLSNNKLTQSAELQALQILHVAKSDLANPLQKNIAAKILNISINSTKEQAEKGFDDQAEKWHKTYGTKYNQYVKDYYFKLLLKALRVFKPILKDKQ